MAGARIPIPLSPSRFLLRSNIMMVLVELRSKSFKIVAV